MLLLLATAAAARPVAVGKRIVSVPILMYHLVGPNSPTDPPITRALTVAASTFAAEMEWLKHAGFHAVSLRTLYDALERGGRLPPHPVAITFDDGYRDVLWYAAPVLHRLRMPATAFIITDRVDGPDSSFLTWPELRRLESLGVAIGSHTVHHLELTLLSPRQALYELTASRRALEAHLHRDVPWFAYPAGRFSPAVERLVQRAGYLLALTTQAGDRQSGTSPFALYRYGVYSWTGLRGLEALLG